MKVIWELHSEYHIPLNYTFRKENHCITKVGPIDFNVILSQLVGSTSGRPDVADVVAVSCTPPPADHGVLSSPGMSGDERVQIYVPSPQSTPYSTISKQAADSHKSITFLSYQPDSLISGVSSTQSHQEESRTETTLVSNSYQEETTRTVSNSFQEETSRVETAIVSSSSIGAEASKEEQQRTMEQVGKIPLVRDTNRYQMNWAF